MGEKKEEKKKDKGKAKPVSSRISQNRKVDPPADDEKDKRPSTSSSKPKSSRRRKDVSDGKDAKKKTTSQKSSRTVDGCTYGNSEKKEKKRSGKPSSANDEQVTDPKPSRSKRSRTRTKEETKKTRKSKTNSKQEIKKSSIIKSKSKSKTKRDGSKELQTKKHVKSKKNETGHRGIDSKKNESEKRMIDSSNGNSCTTTESSDTVVNTVNRACCICNQTKPHDLVGGVCEHVFCTSCIEYLLHRPMADPGPEDNHLAAPTLGRCPECRHELRKFDLLDLSSFSSRRNEDSQRDAKTTGENGMTTKLQTMKYKGETNLEQTPIYGLIFRPDVDSEELGDFHFDFGQADRGRPYFDFSNAIESKKNNQATDHEDKGETNLEQTPIYGLIFRPEEDSEELGDFHFDFGQADRGRPYFDFSNAIESNEDKWLLNDGEPVPTIKHFEEGCFYDGTSRTFHGTISWRPVTFVGSHRWNVVIQFNKDFSAIQAGVIHEHKERLLDRKTREKAEACIKANDHVLIESATDKSKNEKTKKMKRQEDSHTRAGDDLLYWRHLYPFDGRWKIEWKSDEGETKNSSILVRNNEFQQGAYFFNLNFTIPSSPQFRWPLDPVLATVKEGYGDLVVKPIGPSIGETIVWVTTHPSFPEITWGRETYGEPLPPNPSTRHFGIGNIKYVSRSVEEEEIPEGVETEIEPESNRHIESEDVVYAGDDNNSYPGDNDEEESEINDSDSVMSSTSSGHPSSSKLFASKSSDSSSSSSSSSSATSSSSSSSSSATSSSSSSSSSTTSSSSSSVDPSSSSSGASSTRDSEDSSSHIEP
eukprot:CAMPEP_0113448884 /NCGR_PEP_ID=MMETSP0014_2-20120614/5003_1 /TAXON_ID=2857 /ORGANISM="Nitzschia sp." /LENGTH=814 /DNA_ID=CAMNT_0000340123 /DNA_START=269 /DNA_END=2714 /DNA_ORIENTATION=+ /assembly_acc=CAM_ASM_000159